MPDPVPGTASSAVPPREVAPSGEPALLATPYTAPCRRCGRRLHLTEEELVASMTTPPACWHCDGSPGGATTT